MGQMNIGFLNMMADAALQATDRQFTRLLAHRKDVNLHPFSFPEIPRTDKAATYIDNNYKCEQQIRDLSPEAMIITGANVSDPRLESQCFWEPLKKTMDWALQHTRTVLCSCLASHAVMEFGFDQKRTPLPQKIWGVYDHAVMQPDHKLAAGLPGIVPVPQSRHNEVTAAQFGEAGMDVIIADPWAGVHLAANRDNSLVFMQGHPEYDGVSLLKEYKREVALFAAGLRSGYPALPRAILAGGGVVRLEEYARAVRDAAGLGRQVPDFPEEEVAGFLHENWHPAAGVVFDNWLGVLG
jgi:homoserine O-succinyltransferase/O-acetyltransferase